MSNPELGVVRLERTGDKMRCFAGLRHRHSRLLMFLARSQVEVPGQAQAQVQVQVQGVRA